VVLGGPSKFNDEIWLKKSLSLGLLKHVDVFGVHGLRGTWSEKEMRPTWSEQVKWLKEIMHRFNSPTLPIWITEVGYPTVDLAGIIPEAELEEIQAAIFADTVEVLESGVVERVYWYTYRDLVSPSVRFVTTGWEDILQYFFGDTTMHGEPKLLGRLLEAGGPAAVVDYIKAHNSFDLVRKVIDRGDPAGWSLEDLSRVLERKSRRSTSWQDLPAA
jgi:hypothetical protein